MTSVWGAGQTLVASVIKDPEFERQHPRGRDGRFIEKGGYVKFLDIAANVWRRALVEDFTTDGRVKVSYTGSDGKPVEEVMKKNWLYHADRPKATLNPAGWKKVGQQAGSNVGGFFEDKDGVKWYVKQPPSKLHVGNENLMNRLYAKAGAPAPETAVSPDGRRFLTKIEDSADWHTITGDRLETVKKVVAKNFVVDAWLANWDAPLNDNIRVTPENVVLRVDAGGAGLFRARGERRHMTMDVKELQSMRDATMTGRMGGAELYGSVTRKDEEDATKRILAITPDEIKIMVSEEGLPQSLATDLIARRAWLATHYGMTLPESTPEGQALLKSLADAKDAQAKAEAEAAVKSLIKIAPDKAVELGKGAPVWIKNKSVGVVSPAGAKVPDLMVMDREVDLGQAGAYLYFKSKDGKVEYSLQKSAGGYEVLRENNASENAKYSSGETPQVGDRVDQPKGGLGIVTEMFPLYMRVMGDDGKSRVGKIQNNKLVAKAGEHDFSLAALSSPGVLANIGKPADLSNPDAKFPLIVYSLPHRANALVVSYDDTTKKAKVVLSTGQTVTIPAAKLYDDDSVDRDAVKALPVKGPAAARAPRKPVAFDASTLPEKDVQVNREVKITIKPGDRIIKTKHRSNIEFLVIRNGPLGGTIEYAGGNKAGTDSEGRAIKSMQWSLTAIRGALAHGSAVDVTPAKYDQAAFELGATQLVINADPKTVSIKAIDPAHVSAVVDKAEKKGQTVDSYAFRYMDDSVMLERKFTLTPRAGDKIFSFVDSKSPKLGLKSGAFGYGNVDSSKLNDVLKEDKSWIYEPRVVLKRGDKIYDLGYGGRNAEDESAWESFSQKDLDAVEAIKNDYWSTYYKTPEPTKTLSDGAEITYTKTAASPNIGSNFNQEADDLQVLSGKIPAENTRSYTGIPGYSGKIPLVEFLQKTVTGWDKGNPTAKTAAAQKASGSVKQYTENELSMLPVGHVMTVHLPSGDETVTKIDDKAAPWLRSNGNKGNDQWLKNYTVTDGRSKYDTAMLDAMATDTRLFVKGRGFRVDWNFVKQADGTWHHQEKSASTTSKELDDLWIDETTIPGGAPGVAATPVTDFTETEGYKALSHKISVGRDQIRSGELDDRIHEIMNMKLVQPANAGWGRNAIHTLPDGTQHGDPYMAQFAKDFDGDQQTLNAPGPLFNAIKAMTGLPSVHRGVSASDQRDAIKHGDHFNGTGAYGNGVYTAASKGVTSSYGANKVELTAKPGAKGIQNDEMYLQQGEDMADAILDRVDTLSGGTSLPSRQRIEELDLTKDAGLTANEKQARDELRTAAEQMGAFSDDDIKQFYGRAAVKAAVLYGAAMRDKGIDVRFDTGSNRYYYNSSRADVAVTAVATRPRISTPKHPTPGGGAMKFTFDNPWTSSNTSYARAQGDKIDSKKNFMVKTELIEAKAGSSYTDTARITQSYDNGWWIDNFTNHLNESGVAEDLADNTSEWQEAQEKLKKLDSRISFISEPGRWALSAGYDYFYIPGQEFYIFTHRAGFIVKK